MSRLRVMGAFAAPLTGVSVMTPPPYAIFLTPGGVSSSAAPDAGLYPIAIEGDGAAKFRWLYREWLVDISGHIPAGANPLTHPEVSFAAEIVQGSMATTEAELLDQDLATDFIGTGDGVVISDDGVNPPVVTDWNPTARAFICDRSGDFVPPGSPDTNNYYYNPTTGLFLPRIEWSVIGDPQGFISAQNYAPADDFNVNTSVQTFSGTWFGAPMTIHLLTSNTRALDSFSFTATVNRYWEYRDSTGNNPIWHETLGTELLNHSTPLD